MLLSARGILANRFGNVKDFFAAAGKTGENPVFMPPETAGNRRKTVSGPLLKTALILLQ